jgi:hypothetical protein
MGCEPFTPGSASVANAAPLRRAAFEGASSAIAQNDAAHGLLCGWLAGILEARHQKPVFGG